MYNWTWLCGFTTFACFCKKKKVIGFDINKKRINELNLFIDSNNEHSQTEIKKNFANIEFTFNKNLLSKSNVYIITVPTPVTKNKNPDLKAIRSATKIISKFLKKKDIVIYGLRKAPKSPHYIDLNVMELHLHLLIYCH